MSNVSQLPSIDERKNKRRLHLREISEGQDAEHPLVSVGATLRAARLERGHDTAAVAAALKMRREQLDAIEEDDFSKLPGHAYALGFIRSYARYVGLDADALIQRFKDESADQDVAKPVQLVFPEAAETKRLPNASILVLALVIAMVIYGISYVTMPSHRAPVTAKADESAVVVVDPAQSTPETTAPAQPITALVQAPAAPAVEVAAPPTVFVAGSTDLPSQALPAALAPLDTAPVLPPALVVAEASTPSTAAADPATPGSRITMTALEPTYVRIRDPRVSGSKAVLLDRVLAASESFHVPDRAGLVMQTGNAGGLQVAVDGKRVGVLGKRGEVITRIPVDPSYFLERVAAPQ